MSIHINSRQFMSIHVRVFLIYTAQIPHIYIASPVFDPKTNIPTQMNKKNLKNPKFPTIFKISFLRNVNLRKLMVLNFDFQSNVLYALK